LDHILADSRGLGLAALWLETGSVEGFIPARIPSASSWPSGS